VPRGSRVPRRITEAWVACLLIASAAAPAVHSAGLPLARFEMTGASNVVQVSYQLFRRLSLIGRAGSDNALNLVFSLPFDSDPEP
jgi:hypothetical protein